MRKMSKDGNSSTNNRAGEPVKSYVVSGLEVGSIDGNMFLELPKAYTQSKIPVTRDIPTQKDIQRWPHLKKIQLDEIDADIELLIGVNAPKVTEPWQIIYSEGNGPYLVRTVLRMWSMVHLTPVLLQMNVDVLQ